MDKDPSQTPLGVVAVTVIRNRDISRLEVFSDAVFAFAATLLVVALEVPQSFSGLINQLYGFVAFAITFGVLIAIWTIHNAFFRRYALADGWTVVFNSSLLFVVLFYVFPLRFLTETFIGGVLGIGGSGITVGSEEELRQLFMLYSAGFAAVFLFVTLLYQHAWRRREALGLSALQAWEAANLARHYLLFFLVGLVSILVAALGIGVRFGFPGIVYFLLGPLCYLQAVWSLRSRPGTKPQVASEAVDGLRAR